VEQRAGLTLSRQHQVYHVKGFDQSGRHISETVRTIAAGRTRLAHLTTTQKEKNR
jgi:hypothetical protein